MRPALALTCVISAALTAAACTALTGNTDSTNGGGPPTLSSIEIPGSASQTLAPDDSMTLMATGHYSDGSTKTLTDSASWSSDNATAVSVSDDAGTKGRAKAVGAGTAMITASYGGKSGTVTINAASVTAIAVNPTGQAIDSGHTQQLNAVATYSVAVGNPDVTSKATWTSSDTTVAIVNNTTNKGLVTARHGGTATITATYKAIGGNTSVTSVVVDSVVIANQTGGPPGGYFPTSGTLQLAATAYTNTNNLFTVTDSATWSTTTAAMSVSSTGLVSRLGSDSSFVKATFRGKTGKVLLHKGCDVLADNLTFDTQMGLGVARIKVDAGGVVWLDNDGGSGAFRRVATTGGAITTIRSGLPYIGQWDMDANYIYWMWVDSQGAQSYYIVRMSRSTGVVDTLASSIGLGGGARGLAVDASYIYYAPGNSGGVIRMPKAGGAQTAFSASVGFAPRELTLSGGIVYAVLFDNTPHWIMAVPTTGAAVDTLGAAINAPDFQQVNSGYLYWGENGGGNDILRVPLNGSAAKAQVVPNKSSEGFTITGGYLYYALSTSGTSLVRSPVAGGTAQVVTDACGLNASTPFRIEYLTTDGTYVYFVDDAGGLNASRVLRVKR